MLQACLVMKETLTNFDILQAGEELAQHVPKRIFVVGERTLPMRFQNDQPRKPGSRQNAPSLPALPSLPPVGAPLAGEAHSVRPQLKRALPACLRLLVAEYKPALLQSTVDRRGTDAFVKPADALLVLNDS